MMGMKYSFEARLEFALRLSAIFQSPAFELIDKFEVSLVHVTHDFWGRLRSRQYVLIGLVLCSGKPILDLQAANAFELGGVGGHDGGAGRGGVRRD
jgi:hypothetical protein